IGPAHPDGEGFTDNIAVRNHPSQLGRNAGVLPIAAVVRVVAVIAHHEIVPRGHGPLAARLNPVTPHFLADQVFGFAKLFTEDSRATKATRLLANQRFGDWRAVDEQALVTAIAHLVTRQTNYTLDVIDVRIVRIAEDHHVASLRVADVDDLGVHHRQANTVSELVYQDEITDFQGRDHRPGRDLERLDKKRAQHQHYRENREERFPVLDEHRFLIQRFERRLIDTASAALISLDRSPPARREEQQIS